MTANNIPVAAGEVDVEQLDDEQLPTIANQALESGKYDLADRCVDEIAERGIDIN